MWLDLNFEPAKSGAEGANCLMFSVQKSEVSGKCSTCHAINSKFKCEVIPRHYLWTTNKRSPMGFKSMSFYCMFQVYHLTGKLIT